MAKVPIAPEYFSVPDSGAADQRPRLLGSRCPSCAEHFYPRRLVCARCLAVGCDDVVLSPTGTLWTYTYVHVPLFAKKDAKVDGYGVGLVDLPEGPRIQAILVGGPDDFEIGMQLELDTETLRQDDAGDDVVIYRFRPVTVTDTDTEAP
jgi:uncharacterized OB-fold protein